MIEGNDEERRLRRQASAQNAIESARLSGRTTPESLRADLRRWIDGEVSIDDLVQATLAKYDTIPPEDPTSQR